MSKYVKNLEAFEEFEKAHSKRERINKTRKAKAKRLSKDERLEREYNR